MRSMGLFHEKSALLVADMIFDFVDPAGKLYVPGIEKMVPALAGIIAEARAAGAPVIYVNDAHEPDDEEFHQWPEHAVAGTPGTRVVDELTPREGDYVLEKKRYSAFFRTGLDELLMRLGVEQLVVTGTVTNICVMVSAIEALMRGYRVTVPKDGVHALNDADNEAALDFIERVFGGEVV